MNLKTIKFGKQFIGNIAIFKMRFAMDKNDATLIKDLIEDSKINLQCCFNTKLDYKSYDEYAILTIGGAISNDEYKEIISLLHTAAHKHHAKKLAYKFHMKK